GARHAGRRPARTGEYAGAHGDQLGGRDPLVVHPLLPHQDGRRPRSLHRLWFKATKVGEYPIFCAEYCGTSHSDMLSRVIVHPPGGYERWLASTIARADSLTGVDRGKMLYEKQGCSTCHSVDGSPKVGPSWK